MPGSLALKSIETSLRAPPSLPGSNVPLSGFHRSVLQSIWSLDRLEAPQKTPNPTPSILVERWKSARIVRIPDAQLADSIEFLIQHHHKIGFFQNRFEGMQRITGVGPDKSLEIQVCPNRTKTPVARERQSASDCALCDPPFPEERGLRWRDYVVWPNAFPYVPKEKEHVVITSAKHEGQAFRKNLLADMIDYQRFASQQEPVTMHYNGAATNSQFHLHWQATKETLPLQKMLDADQIALNTIHTTENGTVSGFEQGFFAGILVEGSKSFVADAADRIIKKLDTDPRTKGIYTLLLLHSKDGQARLVINPRRADNVKPRIEPFGAIGIGAFGMGGTIIMPSNTVPDGFAHALLRARQEGTVVPSELGWLSTLFQDEWHKPPYRLLSHTRAI